jgi:hypothetical protein
MIAHVSGKTSDLCFVGYPNGQEHDGYVPEDIGIGGGDYIEFYYCLDCGKIQGNFPVSGKAGESSNE